MTFETYFIGTTLLFFILSKITGYFRDYSILSNQFTLQLPREKTPTVTIASPFGTPYESTAEPPPNWSPEASLNSTQLNSTLVGDRT